MKSSEVVTHALELRIKLLERRRERLDAEIADMQASIVAMNPVQVGPAV